MWVGHSRAGASEYSHGRPQASTNMTPLSIPWKFCSDTSRTNNSVNSLTINVRIDLGQFQYQSCSDALDPFHEMSLLGRA